MSSKKLAFAAVVLAVAMSFPAEAGVTDTLVKTRGALGTPVVPGQWHAGLKETKAYAEEHGLPLIAVWSNGDNCGHCAKMENNALSEPFVEWMKESGIVFMFAHSGDKSPDGPEGGDTHKWCSDGWKLKSYPYVRFYWKKDGKVLVDKIATGDTWDGTKGRYTGSKSKVAPGWREFVDNGETDYDTYNPGGRYMAFYVTNDVDIASTMAGVFRNFKPTPTVTYTGGEFADFGDTPQARLEAEDGVTTLVRVPVERTSAALISSIATNFLKAVDVDGKTVLCETKIDWPAAPKTNYVAVTVPKSVSGARIGKKITLILEDELKQGVATNHITYVGEIENSPANPCWIGERTADALAWGEWTMDLDVATNKVVKSAGDATLVLVGGSKWCPDCVKTDRNLLDTEAFRTWAATTHKVTCVTIDVPKMTQPYPSLLTYRQTSVSDRFVQACGGSEDYRYEGGAGYLSRHQVDPAKAAEVAERNSVLLNKDTQHGGLCRPENLDGKGNTGSFKTGIPCLIVLRPDGTVAGRIYQFNNISPDTFDAALITRLDEMLAQCADVNEESNDGIATTVETVGKSSTLTDRTLSFTDQADFYRLDDDVAGKRLSVRVNGVSDAMAIVEVCKADGTIAEFAMGKLSEGIELVYDIPAGAFLCVTYETDANGYPTDPVFAIDAAGSTVVSYDLETDFVLVPTTAAQPCDDGEMTIEIAKGLSYKLVGVDASSIDESELKPGVSDGIYIAQKKGAAKVTFNGGDANSYQIWETGRLGFETASLSVSESDGTVELVVKRIGGSSGVAEAMVELKSAPEFDGVFVWEHEGETNTWNEGESGEWRIPVGIVDNEYFDGDLNLVFALRATDSSDAGTDEYLSTVTVKIRENDKSEKGRIGIAAVEPEFAGKMKVIQKEGSDVELRIVRSGGSSGPAGASLTASAGALSADSVSWETREGGEEDARTVTLTLPSYEDASAVTVALVADEGSVLDTATKTLKIEVVPAEAPAFVRESDALSLNRYVAMDVLRVPVEAAPGASVTVSKFSGSMPAGLEWGFDRASNELVVHGAPTKTGEFSAVFRVKQGQTAGTTYRLSVSVADAAKASGSTPALNPNVAKSRTIRDIVVTDAENQRLAGLVTLTLPANGRASAKMRTLEGTYSLAAKSWSEVASDGTFTVRLTGTTAATAESELVVRVGADQDVTTEVEFNGVAASMPNAGWTKSNPATAWKGTYLVSMPQQSLVGGTAPLCTGDAFVSLKLTSSSALAKGSVTYSGVLPNGKAFSGSATLNPSVAEGGAAASAELVVFTPGSTDAVAALLSILSADSDKRRCVSASESALPYWRHADKSADVSYEVWMDAYGLRYDAADVLPCWEETFTSSPLQFFAVTASLPDCSLGVAPDWDGAAAPVTVGKTTSGDPTITAKGVSLTFNRKTGLVNGSFSLKYDGGTKKVTYRGVVMPGFGVGDCAGGCSYGNDDLLERPFLSGSCWFADPFVYNDGKRDRKISVKFGCPVSAGFQAGK